MPIVYQFEGYDISTDHPKTSRRWGTREAIEGLGRSFKILEDTATEVTEADVQSDLFGFTGIGFNPKSHNGPQQYVR